MARFLNRVAILGLTGVMSTLPVYAHSDEPTADLLALSLEELMTIQVVSASKHEETLGQVPAAIFVLTHEDIIASGMTNLPDLLRLVPGMQVAQRNASVWGVTVRGFNNVRANKLLVMIDGRSVYAPLYAGVFWDQHPLILEDIERIEVIRGPGGAIWGANAVNGIVNIITKSPDKTQGTLVNVRAGTEEGIVEARYGGHHQRYDYSLYAKWMDMPGSVFTTNQNLNTSGPAAGLGSGDDAFDQWFLGAGGLKLLSRLNERNTANLALDFYRGETNDANDLDPEYIYGESINVKWSHQASQVTSGHLQAYYHHFYRLDGEKSDPTAILRELKVFDLEATGSHQRGAHTWSGGVGARVSWDDTNPTAGGGVNVRPVSRQDKLFSFFFQDDYTLNSQWSMLVGAKLERNGYTGTELQPNIRITYMPLAHHVLWAAISRSVRTPSRLESDSTTQGERDLSAETGLSYEAGYRYAQGQWLWESAVFYTEYDDLIGLDTRSSPAQYDNAIAGHAWGIELNSTWQPTRDWKFMAAYSLFDSAYSVQAGYRDGSRHATVFSIAPRHQASLRVHWQAHDRLQGDILYFYVGELQHGIGSATTPPVPAYSRVDVRLTWHFGSGYYSLGAQNLLDDRHTEFLSSGRSAADVERNIYLQAKWLF